MVNNGTRVTRLGLLGTVSAIAIALSGIAHAETWLPTSNMCAFQGGNNYPQVFAYTRDASQNVHLYSAYNSNGWVLQGIVPTGNIKMSQIACDASSTQALVVYRDSGGIKSRDRSSGWAATALPSSPQFGQSETVTYTTDQNVAVFVLFAVTGTDSISMWVWKDSTSPHWSNPVSLGTVPGGLDLISEHALASYAVNVGSTPLPAQVSVFVVSNDGHLRENKGLLTGTRTWIDHGIAPNGEQFSSDLGSGIVASAQYGSLSGHPGTYSETEYYRYVTVPTASGDAVYTHFATYGSTTFSWVQVAGSGFPINGSNNIAGGFARGCTPPALCLGAELITFGFPVVGGQSFGDFYAGGQDPSGSSRTWDIQSPKVTSSNSQTAYGYLVNSVKGMLFYIDSGANNLAVINLDTKAVTSIGHP